ncbi:hypothetical protein [Actinotalea fermentans]|uniref:Uncharacterized protein n=1 Tax=Actinotalea fermentans TaxID=43671 RepID=A0A511YWV0_9CELL|nr:hypothetical protein [Actinotalea fermentans]KGM16611.1 hypothetical protein N867_18280 [Actinotalea fermentans ATCC 43279 = JCM 9966 = DSM 3133]GEN79665.1 hypothetical protein AFE02nite_13990 [Actinotalea fermentans]
MTTWHATALALGAALAAATPTPSPEPAAATGPGIAGFLVTFALVVACIPLFLSMTRKVRGVRYRDADGGAAASRGEAGDGRDEPASRG